MKPTPPCPESPAAASAAPMTAGVLSYDAGGLRRLFAFLLTGDLVFTLVDQIEPKVFPIILKHNGATDTEIAIIVSSITAIMQLLVMPIVSYHSDRLRTSWGRRIPYLFWATPFVSLFLALTPFAPEIATRLSGSTAFAEACQRLHITPVILCFGVITVAYRFALSAVSTMFFCLFRDVVPMSHMGRFLALFRIVGALATFAITYWLVGLAETHSRIIFISLALLNLLGFLAMCAFVKEGTYPPITDKVRQTGTGKWPNTLHAIRNFVSESFTHPIYLWMYLARTCIFAAVSTSAFLIFFPQKELGMSFDQVGKIISWPALIWLALAYPIGRLVDRVGAIMLLSVSLAVITIGYIASFLLITGPNSFLVWSLVTGVAFWAVMLSQTAMAQEVFRPDRFAQLGAANVLVQSLSISLVISPLTGLFLVALSGAKLSMDLPLFGVLEVGAYRCVNLIQALLYAVALLGVVQVRRLWLRHGGPKHYQAPL